MANDADRATERMELESALARRPAYNLPAGKAGDCDLCGEWSSRLVDGACAPCRDRLERMP